MGFLYGTLKNLKTKSPIKDYILTLDIIIILFFL